MRKNRRINRRFAAVALILFTVLLTAGLTAGARQEAAAYYVAPYGDDANPGTIDAPFRTPERARLAVRERKAQGPLPKGGVTVYLREGDYRISSTFVLDAQDSGSAEGPVVYSGYGRERARLLGGEILSPSGFSPVTDGEILSRLPQESRQLVLQYDLKAAGIADYGEPESQSMYYKSAVQPAELFFNGNPMTLGRWPNEDEVAVGEVLQGGDPATGEKPVFQYADDRPLRWTKAKDVFIAGRLIYVWLHETLEIESIDTRAKTVTAARGSAMGVREEKPYFYYNLLEEIDRPGEWYLDRKAGMLYFYPTSDVYGFETALSMLRDDVVRVENGSYITLKNLTVAYGRHNGIVVRSGSNVAVTDCEVYAQGALGVHITGTRNGVSNSKVYNTGIAAVEVTGGDIASLTPSGNYAVNNNLFAYNRTIKTLNAGVSVYGVGVNIRNNLIHDGPHIGIISAGNDNIIEYNELHDVCSDVEDSGAIYLPLGVARLGNIIRYNYIHDLKADVKTAYGLSGIYLDDQSSGARVYGNLLYKIFRPALLGGGRDIVFENNIIVDCRKSVEFDNRGENWQAPLMQPGDRHFDSLVQWPYKSGRWRSQYPYLGDYLQDDPGVPKRNILRNNIAVGSGEPEIAPSVRAHGSIEDPWTPPTDDLGFEDKENQNFKLRADSAVFKKYREFEELPFEKMGLYEAEGSLNAQLRDTNDFKRISPANQAADLPPKQITFSWEPAAGMTYYRLTISEDKDFSSIVYDQEKIKGTRYTVRYLPYQKTLYWRVAAGTGSATWRHSKENADGPGVFTTAGTDGQGSGPLQGLIQEAEALSSDAVIGKGNGEYPKGAQLALNAAIAQSKAVLTDPGAQRQHYDRQEDALSDAAEAFRAAAGRAGIRAKLDAVIQEPEGWPDEGQALRFEGGSMIINDKGNARNIFGYRTRVFEPDELINFSLRVEGAFDGWAGLHVRGSNAVDAAWSGNRGYLFVVKKDQIELQKYGKSTTGFLTTIANTCIEANRTYDIQILALNTPKGVNITLKVDGRTVIDETDGEDFIAAGGYLLFYDYTSGGGPLNQIVIGPAMDISDIPQSLLPLLEDSAALYVGNPNAIIGGERQPLGADRLKSRPFVENGKAYISMEAAEKLLGEEVAWERAGAELAMEYKGRRLVLAADGENKAYTERDGSVFVAVRAVASAAGRDVVWDDRGLIFITGPEQAAALEGDKEQMSAVYGLFDNAYSHTDSKEGR